MLLTRADAERYALRWPRPAFGRMGMRKNLALLQVILFGVRPAFAGAADTLTAIAGITVGHAADEKGLTGCTVVRFPREGAVAGVDVRGSAPGTRETDLLAPTNLIDRVHAIVLSGGSAFGLDAASGVMRCLEEEKIGFDTGGGVRVPIVPAAILYDLKVGDPRRRPTAAMGYAACKSASAAAVSQGNAGAGLGATVGKMLGMKRAMKGGLGSAAVALQGGAVVSALIAVNAVGDVVEPRTGKILAGTRGPDPGGFADSEKILREQAPGNIFSGQNTTIGIVATNVPLSKTQLTKVAQMAHDGLARAVRPSHTMYDGDTLFAVSVLPSGSAPKADVTAIGSAAAEAVSRAIVNAIDNARSLPGLPAAHDWR